MPSNLYKTEHAFCEAPGFLLGAGWFGEVKEPAPLFHTFWEYNELLQPSLPILILITLPVSPWQRGEFKGPADLEQTLSPVTCPMNATISGFIPPRMYRSAVRMTS